MEPPGQPSDNQVTVDAANAIMQYCVGVKCAGIIPDQGRMTEFNLTRSPRSSPGPAASPIAAVRQYARCRQIRRGLEKVCIDTVEAGDMTRDLAILIRADRPWLTTDQFLDKLDANLQRAIG